MFRFLFFSLLFAFLIFSFACRQTTPSISETNQGKITARTPSPLLISNKDTLTTQKTIIKPYRYDSKKGALLSTSFKSFDELKQVIDIEYFKANDLADQAFHFKPYVKLSHVANGKKVSSILMQGVSEADFIKAGIGGTWLRLKLAFNSPYFVFNRNSLLKTYNLSRRRGTVFGEGDMAFYDLAETMIHNISDQDLAQMSAEDLSEKGYLNTFNHITSQVFMTVIFSERLADYIADTHERRNMPELITGNFTAEQLSDLSKGPVDNYVDIINNEWGQELGKELRKKHNITSKTYWTPELLANLLNDIQSYYSWVFQISFKPYRASDEVVMTFSKKINLVMNEAPGLR